jgi:rod shape-determining protein MreC
MIAKLPERRRTRTLLVGLVLTALLLITLDYREGGSGPISSLQRGALAVFGPVAEGAAAVVRPIGNFFTSIGELGSLRDRNAVLEAELEQVRGQQVSSAELLQENNELRESLGMRDRLGVTTTAANVIAQPPNSVERTVLLDAGADQGLAAGMAVINGDGLVGKLIEVTRSNAKVELLTSPSARYTVRIAETREDALLTGQGPNPFQLEAMDPEAEITEGAEVVTRLFSGTAIPGHVPIGVVEGRRGDSRFLEVRPYVDFTRLGIVQVVLDFPQQPIDLPSEQLVEPEPGPRPSPPAEVDEAS